MFSDDTLLVYICMAADAVMPQSWTMLFAVFGGCLAALTYLERND